VPTYDYQCRSCGRITEVIHSMLEDGPSTCEWCGGDLRRVFHPAGIIFRGSGFYKTDSRAAASGSGSSKSTAGGSTGDGAGSTGGSSPDSGSTGGGSSSKGESGGGKSDASSPSSATPSGQGS